MSGWDNGPAIPKFPKPRPPQDQARIQCVGCHDDFPIEEIRERGGWPYCGDCEGPVIAEADRRLTRELACIA